MEMKAFAAADLGNTFLKLCVFKRGRIAGRARFAYREKPDAAFREASAWLARQAVRRITLCSVNRPAGKTFAARLKAGGIRVSGFQKKLLPGMKSAYDLSRIGPDRLANIAAARQDYPEKNLMVLCCGTALVLEVIEERLHLGGFIVPGPGTLLSSLHEKADLLPHVRIGKLLGRPGRTTQEAIAGGCSLFFAGGARAMAESVTRARRKKFRILLTGGGAEALSKIFPKAKKDADLTFRGIRYLSEK